MPKDAITSHPKFKNGMSFQEFGPFLYDLNDGKVCMLTGIRTQESLRRHQLICKKKNDAFVNSKAEYGQNQYRAFPIYDWRSKDVWLAVTKFGWDYNKTYDVYNQNYVLSIQSGGRFNDTAYKTLTFDERNQGWTSFFTYKPDDMFSLGNNFYSTTSGHSDTKDGTIWRNTE